MTEVRSKIDKLKSSIKLSKLMIKTWKEERSNEEWLNKRIKDQEKIKRDAEKELEKLKSYTERAPIEIDKLEKSIRYDEKELMLLENAKLIEKIRKLKEQLENNNAKNSSDQEIS